MNEYYTADPHLCHRNIVNIEPTRKGFVGNPEEMFETIIRNWNAVVRPEDVVNVIGDFGLGSAKKIAAYVARLNGHIRLWPGNHDSDKIIQALEEIGVEIMPLMTKMKVGHVLTYVSHFPMEVGERENLCSLHGHIHGEASRLTMQVNVGVDQDWGVPFGQPIPKEKVFERILEKSKEVAAKKTAS